MATNQDNEISEFIGKYHQHLDFGLNDIDQVTDKSGKIAGMLEKADDVCNWDDYYKVEQLFTNRAILKGNIVCLDALWKARYDGRGFPWYDASFKYALEHATLPTFRHVMKGWCFGFEERDETTSYEDAIRLADKNVEHGNQIKDFLKGIKEKYGCINTTSTKHPIDPKDIE
jgi:hypothetical protein